MRRSGLLIGLAGLSLVVSSCSRATELRVASPCDHPLLVTFSHFDAADATDRQSKSLIFGSIDWALVPAEGTALVTSISDGGGADKIQALWVDATGYRKTVTYAEVSSMSGPVVLDETACSAGGEAPSLLVLVEKRRTRDATGLQIQLAGPPASRDAFLRGLSAIGAVEFEVEDEAADGVVTVFAFATPRGDYEVFAALTDESLAGVIHICTDRGCTSETIDSGGEWPSLFL